MMYVVVAVVFGFIGGFGFSVWLETQRERKAHREWLARMQHRL